MDERESNPLIERGPTLPGPGASMRKNRSDLEEAIRRSRTALLSMQREDGHWCGVLEGDSILESEYLLLLAYLRRLSDPRCHKLAHRLRQLQQPEGGWAIYPGAPPDPSASVKSYFALKLMGDSPDAAHMVRARQVILELGGLEAVNSFTRFYLALHGQLSWDACPAVPPELVMLPGFSPVNLYEMSSWSRAIVVPLTILWARQPVRTSPVSLDEISSGKPPELTGLRGATLKQKGWRTFFHALDSAVRQADRLGAFGLTRDKALAEAERWMVEHLEQSAGLGAIFPSMVYSVLALTTLGHGPDSPLLKQQLEELKRLELPDAEAIRVQPCTSPVWDTALAANAIAATDQREDDAALERAAAWLLDKEVRTAGDWSVRTKCEPGGWYFEYANEFYPDIDDTGQILTTLSRIHFGDRRLQERTSAARKRALRWVLAMQNRSGGWAAFDRDCERELLTCVPFADHNAMLDPACPDITGRMLEALAREGLPPNHPAVKRGVRFLEQQQEQDGSWYGRWGCNYLYGTWLALTGLEACGYDLQRPNIRAAVEWIRAHQNDDGGWGETYRSYHDPEQKGLGPSTAAQTAWALIGLMSGGERNTNAVQRGLDYLLRTQGGDGTWHDEPWTGTGFPRVFYLRYDYYDDYFPLLALAQFRARARGEWRTMR